MSKYIVTIREILEKKFEIESDSEDNAVTEVEKRYDNEEADYILTDNDYIVTEFNVKSLDDENWDIRDIRD